MPIVSIGPVCARRGCQRPPWKDRLCARCWRLGHLFGKDMEMFAYEPLHGYRDDRDAVELPWERLKQSGGRGIADLFADPSTADRSDPAPPGALTGRPASSAREPASRSRNPLAH